VDELLFQLGRWCDKKGYEYFYSKHSENIQGYFSIFNPKKDKHLSFIMDYGMIDNFDRLTKEIEIKMVMEG
jgi:hypothetical protein